LKAPAVQAAGVGAQAVPRQPVSSGLVQLPWCAAERDDLPSSRQQRGPRVEVVQFVGARLANALGRPPPATNNTEETPQLTTYASSALRRWLHGRQRRDHRLALYVVSRRPGVSWDEKRCPFIIGSLGAILVL
jgi:hypothetical protein